MLHSNCRLFTPCALAVEAADRAARAQCYRRFRGDPETASRPAIIARHFFRFQLGDHHLAATKMAPKRRSPIALLVRIAVALLALDSADGCSCYYTHPQVHYCSSDFVIAAKVKEKMTQGLETTYKVKINRKFKLSNDSYNEHLYGGLLYTSSIESMCGVHLSLGESYVVSGRVVEGKPRVSLCDLVTKWAEVTKRQRKGLKGLYAKGCMCDVSYTSFSRKGEALHRANGKLCAWEDNPGPMDCQEKHGICVSNQGSCFWMPSRPYDQCIREHHQARLLQQRPHRDQP
ncbi:tissue inhibitor of metalloproteinase [Phymastichus coffea]|uniref:tissue inhibitor of metalloproteinase n=1 Tax=Phymastichus coffea TaxID=108790 RepID=UPI00273BDE18|nr:tissue inhibitor of metalloproteinase [Phymastichus coffea]